MKIAIIGYGGMGEWHADFLTNQVPELSLAGVYDIREERMEAARQKGIYAYESLKALLDDEQVELVTIATPNNFHKPLSLECLAAGKHVVTEKPAMMNAEELQEVMAAAKAMGRIFTVHQNRRWDKDFAIVREIVQSGVLGEPYMLESRVQGSRRVLCGWRGYQINGGGMLLDWGVHLLDQVLWLVDSPVREVCCHLFRLMPGVEVDDNCKILLRFENGLSALFEVSTNCFVLQPRWHLSCREGTAVIEDWACNGKMVRLKNEDEMAWEESIVYTEAGPTRTMAPRPPETVEELNLPEVTTDLREFYRNVADAVHNGAPLVVRPEQALRVMQVVDLCFRSDAQGKGISCHI